MTLDDLGRDKRAAILAIAARHGVQRVRLFGSFARGDAREDSDVDFLIDAGPRTPPGSQADYCSICKKNWAVE
jgi:predicted nucleotidyltransferase